MLACNFKQNSFDTTFFSFPNITSFCRRSSLRSPSAKTGKKTLRNLHVFFFVCGRITLIMHYFGTLLKNVYGNLSKSCYYLRRIHYNSEAQFENEAYWKCIFYFLEKNTFTNFEEFFVRFSKFKKFWKCVIPYVPKTVSKLQNVDTIHTENIHM